MPHRVHQHHHAPHEARQVQDDVRVVQETVFVTAAKTFDGPIAGWSTAASPEPSVAAPIIFGDPAKASSVAPVVAPVVATSEAAAPVIAPTTGRAFGDPAKASASAPAVIVAPSSTIETSALPSTIRTKSQPTPSDVSSSIETKPTPAETFSATPYSSDAGPVSTAAPTAVGSEQDTTPSGGMTSGAKAGLAIGLLALVALLVAVGFFFYRRKQTKDARGQRLDDEKSQFNNNQGAAGLVPRVSVKRSKGGPRLSLRPVTEMFPPEMSEQQAAAAAASAGGLAVPAAAATRSKSPEFANEKSNPFGDHAKLPEVEDSLLAPKPLNISRPSTPTGAPRAENAAHASPSVAAVGTKGSGIQNGPAGPLNVHRVQLDFAPSMDDELELRQGQLVRMLHEYDDGWALCIRLDRSQQGVVPRSCISKLPVKPRPGPPPGAQGQNRRGPPPANGRPNPGSPRMRSASNAPSSNDRPASPAGSHGAFGDGQYRARSNTDSTAQTGKKEYAPSNLSNSPSSSPATSPTLSQGPMPARKPVPGQAV